MAARPRRFLLYCVGRSGIGQTARGAKLAHYLSNVLAPEVELLIVTGVPAGDHLFRSQRWQAVAPAEIVRLAAAAAEGDDPDRLAMLTSSAAMVARSLVVDFAPDVFITTSHRGVAGEINGLVDTLRGRGCRLALALRDIYYPPEFVDDYRSMSVTEFDVVLVGGPAAVREWAPAGLLNGPLAPRVHFGGYLRPPGARPGERAALAGPPVVHCQVGGGRDGASQAKAVIEALESIRQRSARPVQLQLATGPLMPRSDVQALKSMSSEWTRVRIWYGGTVGEGAPARPPAHAVVSMAGYNSCVEAAWSGAPSVLVPRDDPGDFEQLIRAQLFSGWFPNIRIAANGDPEALAKSISSALFGPARPGCGQRRIAPDNVFALPLDVAMVLIGNDEGLPGGARADRMRR